MAASITGIALLINGYKRKKVPCPDCHINKEARVAKVTVPGVLIHAYGEPYNLLSVSRTVAPCKAKGRCSPPKKSRGNSSVRRSQKDHDW